MVARVASHVTGQMVTRHPKPLVAGNLWARGGLFNPGLKLVNVAHR